MCMWMRLVGAEQVEWMDCEQATEGTWQQSWRALEKLYAEGKVSQSCRLVVVAQAELTIE